MFEKLKIGTEINLILRACAMHAGMRRSDLEKRLSRFHPMFAQKMKTEGLTARQAAVALISYYVSLSDANTLRGLQEHVPHDFYGLCCLWRGAKALRERDPAAYSEHVYVEEPAIDTILSSGFEALQQMTASGGEVS